MKTELECLPCFFRQTRLALDYAGVNGDIGFSIMRRAEAIVEHASLDQAPARITTLIHRMVREQTGLDPYKKLKDSYNLIALGKFPMLTALTSKAKDPLDTGVRLAIAGNIIDFGVYESFDLDRSIEESLRLPLLRSAYLDFSGTAKNARKILYLCDNAGELVFDRILIETLQNIGKSVTVAVKGSPVINDATRDDAAAAGLADSCEVIDNGNDGIGTLLEACSDEFIEAYRASDMIISKGQANYETLSEEQDGRTFFLFKVKCAVVARALNRPNGDIALIKGGE